MTLGLLGAAPAVEASPESAAASNPVSVAELMAGLSPRAGRYPIPEAARDGIPVVDDEGNATIIYYRVDPGSWVDGDWIYPGAQILAIRSTDRQTWSAPQTIVSVRGQWRAHSPIPFNLNGESVTSNARGDILVAWAYAASYSPWTDVTIQAARLAAGSTTWSVHTFETPACLEGGVWGVDTSLGEDGTAAVAIGGANSIVCSPSEQAFVAVAPPNSAWSPLAFIGEDAYPQVAAGGEGRVDIVYQVYPTKKHRWRDPATGTWSAPVQVCSGSCYGDGPGQLVSDGQGRLLLQVGGGKSIGVNGRELIVYDDSAWRSPVTSGSLMRQLGAPDVTGGQVLDVAGGPGRLAAVLQGPDGLGRSVMHLAEVDKSGGIVGVGGRINGQVSLSLLAVGPGGTPAVLGLRTVPFSADTWVFYAEDGRQQDVYTFPAQAGPTSPYQVNGRGRVNSAGQGLLLGATFQYPDPNGSSTVDSWVYPFEIGSSCIRVPTDGGPLDTAALTRLGTSTRAKGEVTRPSLRFGSVEAVGCFEPLAKSDSQWSKVFNGAGFWVNSSPMTRINGIDVPADPGTLLFDTKAMRISWLPTTEFALAMQGVVFYRGKSGGSFRNPFSIKVGTGKTVKILTGADLSPVKGKAPPRVLGMDLAKDVGVRLELGVDRDGGYTQVSTTLGFGGSFDPESVPRSRIVEQYASCPEGKRNSLVKVATKPNPMSTDFRYFRCELANPLDPYDGFAWMPVKEALVSPGISATVRTSNKSGLEVKQVRGVLGQVVAGPLMLENVELAYSPATSTQWALWSLKGTGGLRFAAGPLRNVKVTLGGTIADTTSSVDPLAPSRWMLQGFTVGMEARVPIGGPFSLTRLQMAVDAGDALGGFNASGSLSLAGGIPVTIGPDQFDAFSIDGTLIYTSSRLANPDDTSSQPTPAMFTVQGSGSLAGAPVGQLTVNAELAGDFPSAITKLDVDGDINLSALKEKWKWIKRLGVSGSAKIVGFANVSGKGQGKYQLQGAVRDLSIERLKVGPFGGDIMISDRGIAICAQSPTVSIVAVGFSYLYATKKVTTYLTGCDVATVKSVG